MPPPVRFALAGFGAWGKLHAKSIHQDAGAQLAAICAPTEATRAEARDTYPEAQIFADPLEMIARGGFDIVDVVTPSHTHREIAVAALQSGCHVLLEKPMATTLEDCKAIAAAAEASQQRLALGHEVRF